MSKRCKEPGCTGKATKYATCVRCYRRKIHKERRDELIKMLGDQCFICSEKFAPIAYDFHHKDPAKKKFTIGNQMVHKPMKALKAEAQKCILLCAACHRLAHWIRDNCFDD